MDELILKLEELPAAMREWLAQAPAGAFTLAVERLDDGQILLRPVAELDPMTVAQLRVTIAKYHEALMNLT